MQREVVITGVGVVSPIGIGRDDFWASLCQGVSGVRRIALCDPSRLPVRIAAEVPDFSPKPYVANRKSLKVMSRDAQLGMAAALLACRDAGIEPGKVDPERLGVVLGADRICNPLDESQATYRRCLKDGRFDFSLWATEGMAASFPLGFLRVLPNMIASHVSIAHDARGPNNTIHQAEVSGLLAVTEAASVIRRGAADVMLAGGASSQMNLYDCVRRCALGILAKRGDDPAGAPRPFDARRDGQVWGEGSAVFILEDRQHAEARAARIHARLLSWASACEKVVRNAPPRGDAIRRVIGQALEQAKLNGRGLGHINAHGSGMVSDDAIEALAIRDCAPHAPVTAPKSFFGNLGAAGGAVELAASVLALGAGLVPPTLHYERPDPACPVDVVRGEPQASSSASAVAINWTSAGQATAVVVGR
jgi:3-oxoacyl-[acyl-carrier-protein] synthase II